MTDRMKVLDDLRIELAEYVKLRDRLGTPLTYQQALRSHWEQVRENFRDDPSVFRGRLELLEELMTQEGMWRPGYAPTQIEDRVRADLA